jgi:hypothetical protein
MRIAIACTAAVLSVSSLLAACQSMGGEAPAAAGSAPANTLTAAEQKEGWVLLFDGKDANKMLRGYKKADMPKEWVVEDGTLTLHGHGGDIVTKDEYADFEFQTDWRISPGGNSGIMYHVSEDFGSPWETGPEMQILDDTKHADGKSRLTSAGACYALYPAPLGAVKPVGEWNTANIRCVGGKVKMTLNGVTTAEFDMNSKDWKDRVAGSKFASMKAFGTKSSGHVALQDHGDVVSFRNIKARKLDASAAK